MMAVHHEPCAFCVVGRQIVGEQFKSVKRFNRDFSRILCVEPFSVGLVFFFIFFGEKMLSVHGRRYSVPAHEIRFEQSKINYERKSNAESEKNSKRNKNLFNYSLFFCHKTKL